MTDHSVLLLNSPYLVVQFLPEISYFLTLCITGKQDEQSHGDMK